MLFASWETDMFLMKLITVIAVVDRFYNQQITVLALVVLNLFSGKLKNILASPMNSYHQDETLGLLKSFLIEEKEPFFLQSQYCDCW